MALPLKYNFRNVFVRWRTTAFTVAGIGAVVAVFVLLQALARGIESTGGNTGDPRNILVVRRGSQAESGSLVSRDHFRTLQYFDEIARNEAGEPVISAELVMIVSAPRREGNGEANTLIRGITPRGMELRPQVKLTAGRWFSCYGGPTCERRTPGVIARMGLGCAGSHHARGRGRSVRRRIPSFSRSRE